MISLHTKREAEEDYDRRQQKQHVESTQSHPIYLSDPLVHELIVH